MISLEALNALPVSEFVATLGAIFEHSPWVAERAAAERPFTSRLQLLDAMRAVVQTAPADEQLGLIRAHPQLGARGRSKAQLTEASAREQRRAGLDACTDDEFAQLLRLNAVYMRKFSFPFILAVRGHGPESILAALGSRIGNDAEFERHTALTQIGLIGGYRLADVVSGPSGSEIEAMNERLAVASGRDATESAAGRTHSSGQHADALLREWMLAANLEVYDGGGARPDHGIVGVQQGGGPDRQRLLVGAYHDSTAGALCRDGALGALIGIEVAQQVRQKSLASRYDLLIFAAPADVKRTGSVLATAESSGPPNCAALSAADVASFAPLRAAGITDRCLAIVRGRPAGTAGDPVSQPLEPRTLERAVRGLEELLTHSKS
jgi:OHCU decarboxylase